MRNWWSFYKLLAAYVSAKSLTNLLKLIYLGVIMKYFDAVVLNDRETYSSIDGAYVVLNAIKDECVNEVEITEKSQIIKISDLLEAYYRLTTF